jgi:hypothetical protein
MNHKIPTQTTRFTLLRKVVHNSLVASRSCVKFEGELIRVLFEDELATVRKVFGKTLGVGIRQPVPSLKTLRLNSSIKATAWLRNTDPVRIVTCAPVVVGTDPVKAKCSFAQPKETARSMNYLCSYRGVDFRYTTVKHGSSVISVQCRFVKVTGQSTIIKQLLGKVVDDSVESDSDSSSIFVSKGNYITLDGPKVYQVLEDQDDGTVRCVSSSSPVNDPINNSMETALDGLKRQCY